MAVANEVTLISNAQPATLAQIAQLIAQSEQRLSRRLDMIPIQLYNSTLPNDAPLRYPAGTQVVAGMPVEKRDLFNLSVAHCITTAQALGLPALPNNAPVADRRMQIADYLGGN